MGRSLNEKCWACSFRQEGSIVAEVEKSAVLAMVDQMEVEAAKKEEVLAHPEGSALLCAHDENVSAWIEAINQWLQIAAVGQVQFAQLCQGLGMSRIEVWLGVLLGGFELDSHGEFYSDLLWVKKFIREQNGRGDRTQQITSMPQFGKPGR